MDRSVAKESWKETLNVFPKDVYTPMLDLCIVPHHLNFCGIELMIAFNNLRNFSIVGPNFFPVAVFSTAN
jgi:hypothetical protein